MIMRDLSRDFPSEQTDARLQPSSASSLSSILRVIGPAERTGADVSAAQRATSQDWSELIERVRNAASRIREAEADAQEQELRVRDLLDRVREDMKAAHDRAQAAEARILEIQTRSDALLKSAEERARVAEERARIAESWLSKISQTITEEFAAKDEARLSA